MNLASQSVLEGLNGCLDHRGEVSFLSIILFPELISVFLIRYIFLKLEDTSKLKPVPRYLHVKIHYNRVVVEKVSQNPL